MSLLYARILVVLSWVTLYFCLFSFISVESAFKMTSIQVSYNSIGLCVTTLTDPLAVDCH